MKNILIISGMVLIIGVGAYFVLQQNDETAMENEIVDTQLTDIAGEIIQVEQALAALEVEVQNSTLTPSQAEAARARVQARLTTISSTITASDTLTLSAKQREAMVTTLETMKNVLIRYQSTLVAVDVLAVEDARSKGRQGFPGSITNAFATVTEDFEEQVDRTVMDYDIDPVVLDIETEIYLEQASVAAADIETSIEAEINIETEDAIINSEVPVDSVDTDVTTSAETVVDELLEVN